MKFLEYITKTSSKGHLFVKLIKIYRSFLHYFYYIMRRRVGEYPSPQNGIIKIGFFDKRCLVHTHTEYHSLFHPVNLYTDGHYTIMKPGVITIVHFEGMLMLKKSYMGIWKYHQFYNELICLHRLRKVHNTPRVIYVDYKNVTIYMEYLNGTSFSRNKKKGKVIVHSGNFEKLFKGFMFALNNIHNEGIIVYDLRHPNMIFNESDYYICDFGDSLYLGKIFAPFCEFLKSRERMKLKSELIKSIEDTNYKNKVISEFSFTR